MAGVDESQFSLMSLEEELTCSICLSPFDCPVTIPCGHNFCQECLLATWKDTYSCPQCRTCFATKPELRKNTVLSTVVETFTKRSTKSDADLRVEESKAEEAEVIRCDTCMEAEAAQTCLTCMASFCEEHLRPHRENPVFRLHQLSEPVGDLLQRFCQDHHKLMEFFCSRHGQSICSICLQQVHKGCPVITPEEQRNVKESNLRQQLSLLDKKITKTEDIISQMKDMQNKLKDSATNRNKALAVEYQQIRDMLAHDERDAVNTVDRELQTGQSRLQGLMKKFMENIDNMNKAKEEIHSLLSQSQTLHFLQASPDLPQAANIDPHPPRVTLDSKKVTATQAFAFALKEHLTAILKRPIEARLPIIKPDERAAASLRNVGPQPGFEQPEFQQPRRNPRSHSPGRPPTRPFIQPVPIPLYVPHTDLNAPQYVQGDRAASASGFTPLCPETHQAGMHWASGNPIFPNPQSSVPQPKPAPKKKPQRVKKGPQSTEDSKGIKNKAHSMENLLDLTGNETLPETSDIPPDITSAEKRSELLKYASVLTLDPRTAHKRITLTEGFTVASVSDEHSNYPDGPERFTVCSQVLASKSFSQGRHYWEVRMSSNNFIGIGLAYGTIDRKGPTSRLGRNSQSWCVEWFNVKLSAWHNSCETVLANPNPKRVGVLLDCEAGMATFYNVADRAYPFHTFVFPFAEAVYPAFWMFSSGSSITLCKLQA